MRKTAAAAEAAKAAALYALLVNIPDLSNVSLQGSAKPLLIANSLGFDRTGLVAVPDICRFIDEDYTNPPVPLTLNAVQIGSVVSALQPSYEGDALFLATVPSFGYVTGQTLNVETVPAVENAVSVAATAERISLGNGVVAATIEASGHWDLRCFGPAGANLIAADGTGNAIMVWDDGGDSYAFGNEPYGGAVGRFTPAMVSRVDISGPGLGATVLETGPLRGRVVTVVDYVLEPGRTVRVTREYQLIAGEPMLRTITTLAAPPASSVMVRFHFVTPVDDIVHGTPCHWTDQQPWPLWGRPLFRPTHDFLMPRSGGAVIAALYHNGVPGWASDADGALLGCLARSTNNGYSQNLGTDNALHTLSYALRLADAASPANGQPIMEARSFSTPLDGMVSPGMQWGSPNGNPLGSLPPSDSLAQATPAPAMLIAAKPAITTAGTTDPSALVLRLYQPTNATLEATVTPGGAWRNTSAVTAITALENPDNRTAVVAATDSFTVSMSSALVTVKVAASAKA